MARRVVAGEDVGLSDGRAWSSPALAVLVACLLVLCACLLIPTPGTLQAPEAGDSAFPPRGVPPLEPTSVARPPAERTAAAAIGAQDAPPPGVTAISRPEAVVYGSLLDPAGAPIRGAWSAGVSFVDHTGRRRAADARDEGSYSLHSLEAGTYWVTASADGYRSLEERVELQPDWPRMRKDFTLQQAVELRVKVTTPEGKNLLDVLEEMGAPMAARLLVPVATRELPGKRFDEVTGSLNDQLGVGRFQSYGPRVEKLAAGWLGTLLLDCDLPLFVSLLHHHVALQTKRVVEGQEEVAFVLAPADVLAGLAAIGVRIVDADTGLPIHRARVMLRGGTSSSEGVATDLQGVATIDRREPGLYDLQVWANGYERFCKPIDAVPGETTDLGTIALEKAVTVQGRVIDLEGHPLAASFALGIRDPVDQRIRWFRQEGFQSTGDGSFDIRGLGRGEYVIRTSNHDAVNAGEWEGIPWVSGNLLIDTRGGPISGLEVRLRPASKLVLHMVGGAAGGIRFRVADERGLELVRSRLHGSQPRPLELPAGSYRVSVLDPRGAVLSERSITLGSQTVKLDLAQ